MLNYRSKLLIMLGLLTSLRLMLYLEWILLGITTFTAILIASITVTHRFPWLAISCLAGMTLVGLKLPTQRPIHKILYTLAEFGLVWIPGLGGDWIPTFPLLGIVIVLRSCQMFELPGRLVVAEITFLWFVLTMFLQQSSNWFHGRLVGQIQITNQLTNQIPYNTSNILILKLNATVYFGLMLVCVLLLVNALLAERESRKELFVALSQLRQYALRIEDQSALEERNRIAREIHDALGHTLTAQSIQLDSGLLLLQTADIDKATSFFRTAKTLCTQALKEVRQSVTALRTDRLPGNSLDKAIAILVKDLQITTTIIPNCTIHLSQAISPEVSYAIYRIIQEALTNITRHSNASEIAIQLVSCDQMLYLMVKDNGKGFDPKQNLTGFGLQGMRERTNTLKGQFSLVSQPGAGCLITTQIPLLG